MVFITPYVLDTPEEVAAATEHRRDAVSVDGMWKRDWSDSDLATPPKKKFWQRKHKKGGRDSKKAVTDGITEARRFSSTDVDEYDFADTKTGKSKMEGDSAPAWATGEL